MYVFRIVLQELLITVGGAHAVKEVRDRRREARGAEGGTRDLVPWWEVLGLVRHSLRLGWVFDLDVRCGEGGAI